MWILCKSFGRYCSQRKLSIILDRLGDIPKLFFNDTSVQVLLTWIVSRFKETDDNPTFRILDSSVTNVCGDIAPPLYS